jgi:hypothetical protein
MDLWFTYRAGVTQWEAVITMKVSSGSTKLELMSKKATRADLLIRKMMSMEINSQVISQILNRSSSRMSLINN